MNRIDENIVKYIEQFILPLYHEFDKAHSIEHVQKVIKNSSYIADEFDVNINMVYAIAAYHDVGLKNGRENHEKASSFFLLSDVKLLEWFTDNEIHIMAEAVEDHRASNDCEPRSIYGKIVAEADRDIEYETVLTRMIQYSIENYSDYDFEEHFERTFKHMQDKYGENGYIKLWLNTEANRNNLTELRKVLHSKEKFKNDFKQVFNSI